MTVRVVPNQGRREYIGERLFAGNAGPMAVKLFTDDPATITDETLLADLTELSPVSCPGYAAGHVITDPDFWYAMPNGDMRYDLSSIKDTLGSAASAGATAVLTTGDNSADLTVGDRVLFFLSGYSIIHDTVITGGISGQNFTIAAGLPVAAPVNTPMVLFKQATEGRVSFTNTSPDTNWSEIPLGWGLTDLSITPAPLILYEELIAPPEFPNGIPALTPGDKYLIDLTV